VKPRARLLGLALALAGACRNAPLEARDPRAPARYRIEAATFALERADAERVWLPYDEHECALAVGVDAREVLQSAVSDLQQQGRVQGPLRWAEVAVENEQAVRLAAPPALARELELRVRPMWREAWAPLAVEVQVVWRAADGALLAELPAATFPVPEGATLRLVCLPARTRGPERALLTFVRAVPLRDAP